MRSFIAHIVGTVFRWGLYIATSGLFVYVWFWNIEPNDAFGIQTLHFATLIFFTSEAKRLHQSPRYWFVIFSIWLVCVIGTYAAIYLQFGLETDCTASKPVGNCCLESCIVKDPLVALYFSIVTWTTLGYGDFSPSESIRLVAALEAMLGYLAMALLVGQILNWIESK